MSPNFNSLSEYRLDSLKNDHLNAGKAGIPVQPVSLMPQQSQSGAEAYSISREPLEHSRIGMCCPYRIAGAAAMGLLHSLAGTEGRQISCIAFSVGLLDFIES